MEQFQIVYKDTVGEERTLEAEGYKNLEWHLDDIAQAGCKAIAVTRLPDVAVQ